MQPVVHQGDVLHVENIRQPVFVASKDFFNSTGEVIGCPIYLEGKEGALHICVSAMQGRKGYIYCEKLALLDLHVRGYTVLDHIQMADVINVTDAIQSIFDYI